MNNPIEDFRAAMLSAGVECKEQIKADGERHRFNSPGEKGLASWYRVWQNGDFFNACFGCWRRGISDKWNSYNGANIDPEERRRIAQQMAQAQQESRTEEEKLRSEAKIRASQILSAAGKVDAHLYLMRKSVGVYGEMRLAEKDFQVSPDWKLPINNCLVLPLRTIDDVLQTLEFIAPDKRFGREEKRDKQLLFGGAPKGAFYTINDNKEGPLVICEGYATGATIFESTGYATVCTRNAGNLLPVAQAFRKKYPKRDIIIAADNDRFVKKQGEPYNPGMEYGTQAATNIKAALAFPEFSDSDDKSSDFNDLADVSGGAIVKAVIEKAYRDFLLPKFDKLPAVDNASDLAQDETVIEPPQLIVGLLHKGLKCVIGSGSKAYKSWILWDLAISIASGKPFWMFPTTQGKVLVLNFEIPRWSMKSRIREVARKRGIGFEALKNIDVWSLRGYATELFKLLPDLTKQVLYGGYDLVILDPIYKVLGGRDENAAGDVAAMCNELESICVQSGAAVAYAAHFSKGNQSEKEAMDRIGGSGVFGRDPDTIITLTKHEEEDAYTVDCILRNLPRVEPFVMKLDFPIYVQVEGADPDSLKRPGKAPQATYEPDAIALLLEPGRMSSKSWQKRAMEEFGVSRAQFFRIRDMLVAANRVLRSPINGEWTLITARQQPESEQQRAIRQAIDRAADQTSPEPEPELPPDQPEIPLE